MRSIQISSLFNAWLSLPAGSFREEIWGRLKVSTQLRSDPDAATGLIARIVSWRENEPATAIEHWARSVANFPTASANSRASLQHAGIPKVSPSTPELLAQNADLLSTD